MGGIYSGNHLERLYSARSASATSFFCAVNSLVNSRFPGFIFVPERNTRASARVPMRTRSPIRRASSISCVMKSAQELLVNARTLGATDLGLTYRVVLPMVIPDLLQTMRLNMGIAWYCLLMGEAIAAQQGLGYRIFLFRRVGPDMAGILPYVICITLFAFAIYYLLGCIERRLFPWKTDGEKQ